MMKNLFQSLRNLLPRRPEENGYYDNQQEAYDEQGTGGDDFASTLHCA